MNYFNEAITVMKELYGQDVAMPLATVNGDKANIRVINAYYKENAFYITTYSLSNKMKEITKNPNVALNHNLFVAHGTGNNIGNPLEEQNRELREELKQIFYVFYDKHVCEEDTNTCILKISLTDSLVFAHDYKYFIDFKHKTATREKCVIDISRV
ncbi:pyridoxamine 5'-phosphate oxidase family protein [Clostridium estertheticum]|uniref:pyridoxamine 5'-phosphate oxidase family protein n=1 Tax=Clostridium estertheticum TaxID=238834 RepID=UPI001C0C9BBD|nr:pyridoxamine 5'-phosphate oxidase family protein [Clostridium estertheticum]MBU3187445.1 pyridoxamine 5'-phosphate oxidase family protein [Clostridium estertheticum]MCB2342494.1 pyridoxamine 5'-phosphate oxidase family protein [Clostridium estertheticum]